DVESVRPVLVARNLCALPGTEVGIEFAAKLGDLFAYALEFGVRRFIAGKIAQIFDIFFETLDFFSTCGAVGLGLELVLFFLFLFLFIFIFGAHAVAAISTARSPQIWRTASTSSGLERTRCWACSSATEPSAERSSNTTTHEPGKFPNKASRRSSAPG